MKILILGGGGMLGHKLVQVLGQKNEVKTTLKTEKVAYAQLNLVRPENIYDSFDVREFFDVRGSDRLRKLIGGWRPDVIINAVGIIKQHETIRNEDLVRLINAELPKKLFEIAGEISSRLICISTDCVFSGQTGGYVETDLPDADDLYGRSKAEGEIVGQNSLTIRTSIIGRELKGQAGLIEWFLAHSGKSVKGFQRAVFSGFPTVILAELISEVIENHRKLEGLYHVAAAPIDKYSLLNLVNEAFDSKIQIEPFADFEINRSLNGHKFEEATGWRAMSWPKMIEKMVEDARPYKRFRDIYRDCSGNS